MRADGWPTKVGLPRVYWWGLAAGWVALGAIGEFGPDWLTIAATLLFGAMLVVLVLLTIAVTVVLDADGADHARLLGSVFVAVIVGFGGPEMLAAIRRAVHA